MIERIKRWKAKWELFKNFDSILNRRVHVEQALLDMAGGKRPLPSRNECRELAQKLGNSE